MDRISSPKTHPSPECVSDAEEKEISDDDDRNHKHRRRDNRYHSLDGDSGAEDLFRPSRKRNKPFDNGVSIKEGVAQSNDIWRNFNFTPLDNDLAAKFDRRRTGFTTLAQAFDVNQKIKLNHAFSDECGSGRGRGCSGPWSQRDSRFNSVAIASQMVHQGSVHPRLFAGRGGLPSVSSASATASWGAYGLISGLPSGRLDTIHSLGLHGTIGASMNPSLSIGIPRQRCKDFEERGFCLRGDICPMEHGVNRIVIEDVQSLSQFNLPVSLPNVRMLGTTAGSRSFPLVSTSGSKLNIKGKQNKNAKVGVVDDKSNINLDGTFSSDPAAYGADFYDPDQPLWNNDSSEASTALLDLNSSKVCGTELASDAEVPDTEMHHGGAYNGVMKGTNPDFGGLQCIDSSMWGRAPGSKLQDPNITKPMELSFSFTQTEVGEGVDKLIGGENISHQRNRKDAKEFVSKPKEFSNRKNSAGHDSTNSSKVATKTLFVCGLPEINEKKGALLSHFKKFGKVIDIFTPLKGGRAFIQFSKREEAEAALSSPDAVMGNRFIKVLWAYRDTICHGSSLHGSDGMKPSIDVVSISVPPKTCDVHAYDSSPSSSTSGSKNPHVSQPPQKKLANFQLLKELRKKQELLDQKRIEFSRQLLKYEKAKCVKMEASSELSSPKPKPILNEHAKHSDMKSTVPSVLSAADGAESAKIKSTRGFPQQNSISCSTVGVHDHTNLRQSQFVPTGTSSLPNPFKLDNRPTSFQIIPPLPPIFEDSQVDALKEHFLSFSDLSTVELDDLKSDDSQNSFGRTRKCSARVSFATHTSAENAFKNGRSWKGFTLNFKWIKQSDISHWKSGKWSQCVYSPNANSSIPEKKPDVSANEGSACLLDTESVGEGSVENEAELSSAEILMSCQKELLL